MTPAAIAARGAAIATGFVGSFTLGTGQLCTKPGLLFLPSDHRLDDMLAGLVSAIEPTPMLNTRIRDQLTDRVGDTGAVSGVRRLARGADSTPDGAWASPQLFTVTADSALANPSLLTQEQFGPAAIVVTYDNVAQVTAALAAIDGSLTAAVHAEEDDPFPVGDLLAVLRRLAGRVIFNGWPTGVAVTWSMNHGGPWPSSTNASHTSVGGTAVRRWQRPVCYQSVPFGVLPKALRDENPWGLPRRVDERMTSS